MSKTFYGDDLAYFHEVGFSHFAEGIAAGVLEVLRKAGIHDGLVVDAGCGSGRWAKRLMESGYRVLGIDYSPAMIEIARQKVQSAEFHAGSIWNFSVPPCRAITALGEVLCYRNGADRHDLGSLFRKLFRALEPGGLLVFDVAELGLGGSQQSASAVGEDWACLVKFDYNNSNNRLIREITTFRQAGELFRRSRERHVVQLYDGKAVARLLKKAGFRVRHVRKLGAFPTLPNRLGFIARKP